MRLVDIELSNVVEFLDSQRRPIKESERISGDVPYYGANGQQGWVKDYLFDETLILLAEDGGHFFTPERGIAYVIEGKSWVNNHAHVLRVRPEFNFRAVFFALRNLDVRRYLTGSTRAKLTKSAAERIKLTLPEDRDDQERIASILDQASATAEVCKKSIEELDKLQQSVFLEMFGDPVKNSKGWPVKTLLSLCDQSRGISYGVVQRGQHVEGGIPLVRIKDILNGIVDPNSLVNCEKKIVERYERTSLKGGELLISIRGTVGVTALVPESLQGANISREIAVVPLVDSSSAPFVLAVIASEAMQYQIYKGIKGVAQRGINLEYLKSLQIIQPPIELLEKFKQVTSLFEIQRRAFFQQAEQTKLLFESLQARAFLGEL